MGPSGRPQPGRQPAASGAIPPGRPGRLRSNAEKPPLSEEAAALLDALRRLPSSHRQALLLHYALDLPVSEVAVQLRLPASTVRGRLARARKHLRRFLAAKAGEVDASHG